MKIVEALISEIKEDVSVRPICGGMALMHGNLTITAVGLLDDGRCVRFRIPSSADMTLLDWGRFLSGCRILPSDIIEDLSNPSLPPKEIEI